MAKVPKATKPEPLWVIDLHGMQAALSTQQNSLKVAVADAIESGHMHIIKSVSGQMKDLYPELYADFQAIKNKKYLPISVAASAAAAMLMEGSGANPLGGIPLAERFEALAAARKAKCSLVSAGKAHGQYCAIANQNGLPASTVLSLVEFSLLD